MCGIAGGIGRALPVAAALEAMRHRGPDAQTVLALDGVQLLHARLSIVDAEGGAQPMRRGPLSIVYNGEIYNHRELRRRHALACRTASDTETLLALFERQGIDCLAELDGMFAFALHDAREDVVWFARDRAGEKPLYLWRDAASLAFASELNTLRATLPLVVDEAAVNGFLSCGVFHRSATPYVGVTELPPGSWARVDCRTLASKEHRWFALPEAASDAEPTFDSEKAAMDAVERALREAVRRQLLAADVEVGAFLSGGIDSGLVCAFAAAEVDTLRTFTVAFEDQFDESALAASVAARHGTRHERISIGFEHLAADIDQIVGNYGEPVCDDSIVPSWYVSRAARERVKVVLTGDGADEQFGGYRRYVPYARFDLFREAGGQGAARASWLTARLPASARRQSAYNYLYRFAALLSREGVQRYIASTSMIDGSMLAAPAVPASLAAAHAEIARLDASSLAKLMRMDFGTLLPDALLPKMDIAAMAHSLEARNPFLSREVIAVAARLPDAMKVRGRVTKHLLRELAARHLPPAIRVAPKRGFEVPLLDWLDGRLREPIHDRLGAPGAWVRRFCADGALDALLDGRSAHPPAQRARLLWTLFCTETWYGVQRTRGAGSRAGASAEQA